MNNRIVNTAKEFAALKHAKQADDNGKPHILHATNVALMLSLVTDDAEVIAAGFLHDTLEDTDTTYTELASKFGERVADLVVEVTHEGLNDSQGYYFPNLKSRWGFVIKLVDRADNLSRMDVWDAKRQAQYLSKSQFWRDSAPAIGSKHDGARGEAHVLYGIK